jgi:hypothetical protein
MATTIKVATAELLKLLEARLAESDEIQAKIDEFDKKQEALQVKWAEQVLSILLKKKAKPIGSSDWSDKVSLEFSSKDLNLPPRPQRARHTGFNERLLGSYDRKELVGTIALLKLTSEPTVSASTYKKIIHFL